MKRTTQLAAALVLVGFAAGRLPAGPITGEEARRRAQVLQQLKTALAGETTDAGRFAQFARVMKVERSVEVRRQVLEMATRVPGPEHEKFLTGLLTSDPDAGLRSQAATTLGRTGSEKCLAALAEAAANDRTTRLEMGDIGSEGSARRAATFAIAQLAARFPGIADAAAAKLRALPAVDNPKDGEGLADARVQALYQITRDRTLLKPFYERLQSKDAAERVRGVVAFRFLHLKEAPGELLDTLKDSSSDVRSWSALVLGEIGDPKTAAALMTAAGDPQEDVAVRCNAIQSLGRMKTPAAAELMEKLLTDSRPIVQSNAAISLYRLTGKKVKQLPDGYSDR